MIFQSTVAKVWEQPRDDGSGVLVCFTLAGTDDHAFVGASDWGPLLREALELRTCVRVMASEPEIVKCDDPLCGDGCCDDPNCTNVPAEERQMPFVLRADTIEWLREDGG